MVEPNTAKEEVLTLLQSVVVFTPVTKCSETRANLLLKQFSLQILPADHWREFSPLII